MGIESLKVLFRRLYQVATCKGVKVAEADVWQENNWVWQWTWRHRLFAWEESLLVEMQNLLVAVNPLKEGRDTWVWLLDPLRDFSVKSTYCYLLNLQVVNPVDDRMGKAYQASWRCQSFYLRLETFVAQVTYKGCTH